MTLRIIGKEEHDETNTEWEAHRSAIMDMLAEGKPDCLVIVRFSRDSGTEYIQWGSPTITAGAMHVAMDSIVDSLER